MLPELAREVPGAVILADHADDMRLRDRGFVREPAEVPAGERPLDQLFGRRELAVVVLEEGRRPAQGGVDQGLRVARSHEEPVGARGDRRPPREVRVAAVRSAAIEGVVDEVALAAVHRLARERPPERSRQRLERVHHGVAARERDVDAAAVREEELAEPRLEEEPLARDDLGRIGIARRAAAAAIASAAGCEREQDENDGETRDAKGWGFRSHVHSFWVYGSKNN